MNLAALEAVDYVLIDRHPDPLENIRYLEPDFFAKGNEYIRGGLHPKTARELHVVDSYGGEMIFTADDIVYSSSQLIEQSALQLGADRFEMLLDAEDLDAADLRNTLMTMRGLRVHVVGDTIVDSLTSCTRLDSQAPTCSLRYEAQIDSIGGAALVAKHFRKAGAEVVFSTVLGDDALQSFVLRDLDSIGISCRPIIDPTRPTTQKNVLAAGSERFLKLDRVDNRPICERSLRLLQDSVQSVRADAVVFSDFRHGIFHRGSIPSLTGSIPVGAFTAADSQVASRWGNILDYQGFDLITPNELEARFALGDQDSSIHPLAATIYEKARCQTLILKLGKKGILTRCMTGSDLPKVFRLDSFASRVVDATGAGDSLLAYSTLALVTTRSPVIASVLGSLAAGITCEREVNEPISPADVADKLSQLERRSEGTCALSSLE